MQTLCIVATVSTIIFAYIVGINQFLAYVSVSLPMFLFGRYASKPWPEVQDLAHRDVNRLIMLTQLTLVRIGAIRGGDYANHTGAKKEE